MVRPHCARAGQLQVEARYLPPADGPGGDIYDIVATPFGVRLLIGDVMGTGQEASQVGALVLGAWRELAHSERSLAGVAVRLHALITRSGYRERFVTALLITFPDPAGEPASDAAGGARAELVCCGHPPPLLVRGGTATFLHSLPAFPPLGLLDLAEGWCATTAIPFGDCDRLLLYTDGVSEARDSAGQFFPLSERVAAEMRRRDAAPSHGTDGTDGEHALDRLLAGLREHIGAAAARDDILMVLVQRG